MADKIDKAPLDQLTFKTSHNSFEYGRLSASLADQLVSHGCRGLELDLVQDPRQFRWCVRHGGTYVSTESAQLEAHLKPLKAWSDTAQDHDPIIVHLDLKGSSLSDESFPERLDEVVGTALTHGRLFRPIDLLKRANKESLVEAVESGGWPTLEELRGTFLLCLSGHETRKARYANTRIEDRLCFSDRGSKGAGKRVTGNRVFINHHIVSTTGTPRWPDALRELRKQPGLIFRAYYCNPKGFWDRAVGEGVNLLATDEIRIRGVGERGYRQRAK